MASEKSDSILVGSIAWDAAYAGFSRGNLTGNEHANPGLGQTIAYHGGGKGEATVFVYTMGHHGIPDGPMSEIVMAEFNRATRELIWLGQKSDKRMELISRYGTGSPDRGKEFLCAEFILTDGLESRRTFLYLTGSAKNFVKIRVTLRTKDGADPTAREFADAVASRLFGGKAQSRHRDGSGSAAAHK